MKTEQILLVIILWLLINALFPLFLKSVDRLYQKEIDQFVAASLSIGVTILLRVFQLLSIIIMLPNISLVTAAEHIVGPDKIETASRHSRILAQYIAGVKFVMRRDFPNILRTYGLRLFNRA